MGGKTEGKTSESAERGKKIKMQSDNSLWEPEVSLESREGTPAIMPFLGKYRKVATKSLEIKRHFH